MKRSLTLILIFVLLICYAGCNADNDSSFISDSSARAEELESLRGTEIVICSSIDYALGQHPTHEAITDFIDNYDIKVNTSLRSDQQLISSVKADIAADRVVDLVQINGQFPSAISVLQPIENSGINLNDEIWIKNLLDASEINGKPYLIDGKRNIESLMDVCLFNNKVFSENEITSPAEFYERDEWTLDNFWWCAQEVSKLGKGYVGVEIGRTGVISLFNAPLFEFTNNKLSKKEDGRFYSAASTLIDAQKRGIATFDDKTFRKGKTGIAVTDLLGMFRFGHFGSMHDEDINAIPLPKSDSDSEHIITSPYRGWGLGSNSSNPKAAGFLLEYILNHENLDLSQTFLNSNIENAFNQITDKLSDKIVYYPDTEFAEYESFKEASYYIKLNEMSEKEYNAYLDKKIPELEEKCDIINKEIENTLK